MPGTWTIKPTARHGVVKLVASHPKTLVSQLKSAIKCSSNAHKAPTVNKDLRVHMVDSSSKFKAHALRAPWVANKLAPALRAPTRTRADLSAQAARPAANALTSS